MAALNIHLTNVKEGLISTYHAVAGKSSEWLGRGVALIKSGIQEVLPHLQDQRVAIVSLVAMNLLLIVVLFDLDKKIICLYYHLIHFVKCHLDEHLLAPSFRA